MLDFEEDRTVPAEPGSGRCGNADCKRGSDGHDRSDDGTAEKQGVTENDYENRNENRQIANAYYNIGLEKARSRICLAQ